MDYRQQGFPYQWQLPFPGLGGIGTGGGNYDRRLDQIERKLERHTRRLNRLNQRLERVERQLGLGGGYGNY